MMMGVNVTGAFESAANLAAAAAIAKTQTLTILAQEAEMLKSKIRMGIRNQAPGGKAFAKLADTTIALRQLPPAPGTKARKGSTKALINNADLLHSVNVTKLRADRYFVGVHRKERSTYGERLENIAMMQEEGTKPYLIEVTPEMHRFFIFLKLEEVVEGIPPVGSVISHPGLKPRPFLVPSYEEWEKEATRRFEKRLLASLGPLGFRKR